LKTNYAEKVCTTIIKSIGSKVQGFRGSKVQGSIVSPGFGSGGRCQKTEDRRQRTEVRIE
jgi:hypothetical protein